VAKEESELFTTSGGGGGDDDNDDCVGAVVVFSGCRRFNAVGSVSSTLLEDAGSPDGALDLPKIIGPDVEEKYEEDV